MRLRALTALAIAAMPTLAGAHDARRPELNKWFEGLHSDNGPCCSNADGSVLIDADWESKDGHYRVRIKGEWVDVPDEAVVTDPNRDGRTIVWPVYIWNEKGGLRVHIRCFMPGSMT